MRILTVAFLILTASAPLAVAAPETKAGTKPSMKPAPKQQPAAAAHPGTKKLSPEEIKAAFFDGKPFIASTPAGVRYKMTFMPDGRIIREPESKSAQKGEGTWSLSKDGFCTAWKSSAGKDSAPNCYKLFASGENQWSVSNGSSALATWSR